jgi:hypothetical protein
MSALVSKADMCGAVADVGYGPKADIAFYSITSMACASGAGGTVMPSALERDPMFVWRRLSSIPSL